MTADEAKKQWTGGNHLEKWRTMFGPYVTSGTEAHGVVHLVVDLRNLEPEQQDYLMHLYSRGMPVSCSVTFL